MNRLYESPDDLVAEREIVDQFCRWRGCKAEKLGKFDLDFAIFKDGSMVAIAEVKDRKGWKPEYRTVMLSTFKVNMLVSYAETTGVTALFIVRLCGGVRYVQIKRPSGRVNITWSGRRDRGNPLDMEPCIHIPFEQFKVVPA